MPKPGTDKDKKNSDSKDKKDENKPGFFKKIWGSVFDKKKDEKKEDPKKPSAPLKDGDMDFEEETKEEAKAQQNQSG